MSKPNLKIIPSDKDNPLSCVGCYYSTLMGCVKPRKNDAPGRHCAKKNVIYFEVPRSACANPNSSN